jgi:hypothetical protein
MGQINRQTFEARRTGRPIVERGLKAGGDMAGIGAPGQIIGHNNQAAVSAVFQGRKFHPMLLSCYRVIRLVSFETD